MAERISSKFRDRWLSDDAIEEIIRAVGEKYEPPDLDRDHFRDSLEHAYAFYMLSDDPSSKTKQKRRMAKTKKVAACADELAGLIGPEGDEAVVLRLLRHYDSDEAYKDMNFDVVDAPSFDALLVGLHALKISAELELAEEHAQPSESAFRAFIYKGLGDAYRRYFKREPKVSRHWDTSEVYGPYVRFVQAVAREFGIREPAANTIGIYVKPPRT